MSHVPNTTISSSWETAAHAYPKVVALRRVECLMRSVLFAVLAALLAVLAAALLVTNAQSTEPLGTALAVAGAVGT
jgi:hypothetical protein